MAFDPEKAVRFDVDGGGDVELKDNYKIINLYKQQQEP